MKAMLIRLRPWGLVIVALVAATLAVAGTVWWCEREPASPFGDQDGVEFLYRTTMRSPGSHEERPPSREDMIEARRRWEATAARYFENATVELLKDDLLRLRLPGRLLVDVLTAAGPDPSSSETVGGWWFQFSLLRVTEYHSQNRETPG